MYLYVHIYFVGWLRGRQWPLMGWSGRMAALPAGTPLAHRPVRRRENLLGGHPVAKPTAPAHIAHSTVQLLCIYTCIYIFDKLRPLGTSPMAAEAMSHGALKQKMVIKFIYMYVKKHIYN